MSRVVGTGRAAADRAGCRDVKGLVHDPPDCAGTSAALGAATQTPVDLSGRARARIGLAGGPDIAVGEDVTGTDDHWRRRNLLEALSYSAQTANAKENALVYTLSNLGRQAHL